MSGLSAYAIAGSLNKQKISAPGSKFWTTGSVTRILKNISYTGVHVTGKTRNNITTNIKTIHLPPEKWIRHNNHHDPIVDEITFFTIQQTLSSNNSFKLTQSQSRSFDFFDGMLYCGICGRKLRLKISSNESEYYICPQRDTAGSSCHNKARSARKLKKMIFIDLTEKINELRADYRDTIKYESSPYYLQIASSYDKRIKKINEELDHQYKVFKRLFEESVVMQTNRSVDFQGLMRHLMRIRTNLNEQLNDIINAKHDYRDKYSSESKKFFSYQKYNECTELTSQMLTDMVEKVFVDTDSVRIVDKCK